ncbi:hypothetical protein [Paenibacillus polymyxa]|uniref:hypothetical protein n=1 Tax=Paenibacillus TaxID=44249 RepID=UPI00234AFFC5|nr:hypothetical protein [Paenibacillus polymyxa]WCM62423.1 hypothetical protein OYT09_05525 [Paenibacillus polymyxa]
MHEANPDDPAVRYAIYKAYGEKCFYLDRPLDKNFYTLDHIIPEKYKKQPEALAQYLGELGYTETFHVNSLENLVPAERLFNTRVKRDDLLPPVVAWPYLKRAESKIPYILKEIDKFNKKKDEEKALLELLAHANENSNREQYAKQVFDLITEEDSYFEGGKQVVRYGEDAFIYKNATPNVHIYSLMPTLKQIDGTCLITFKSLKIRDCMITFSHNQIINILFQGLHTNISLGMRRFIVGIQNEMVCLQFPNNRFFISIDEVQQLCNLIDDFVLDYINALQRLEIMLGITTFEKAKYWSKGYRLMKVDHALWNNLLRFSNEFDYLNGDTEWHIFNRNNMFIQVQIQKQHLKKNIDLHLRLVAERCDDKLVPFNQGNSKVWIVWDIGHFENDPDLIQRNGYWDAVTAFEWLADKFIPYVIAHYNYKFVKRNKWSLKKPSFEDYKTSLNKEYLFYPSSLELNNDHISGVSDLIQVLKSMQSYLSNSNSFFLNNSEIGQIYDSISICLKRIPLKDYSYEYISRELGCRHLKEREDIIMFIDQCEHTDKKMTNRSLQLLFGCIVEGLEQDFGKYLTQLDLQKIVKDIKPVKEKIEIQMLFDRWVSE